ncbi:uncharacterized protein TNCV_3996631 [Trichonephila clavipes]|nr:uncharacterized protein TNCV_3996631 [Trichonephila clavipes]
MPAMIRYLDHWATAAPTNYGRQSILKFVQSSTNIIDADCDGENEIINVASCSHVIRNEKHYEKPWVAKWLEHRTADRKGWVRCPMPPNTLRVHTEYVLVKSVGPKVLWAESRVQGTGEYFPPLQFHAKIVDAEIDGVAIYRPFGEFRGANSYCRLYGVQGQRQAYF